MLNLDDPLTSYVFKAAIIEDKISKSLQAMRNAKGAAELIGHQEQIQFVLTLELLELNKNHFRNLPGINNNVMGLRDAVGRLDYGQAQEYLDNLTGMRKHGENFGTWAI